MAVPFSNTRLRVPKGFQNVLEGLAREVLRSQPENILIFSEAYFEELLRLRLETGYDDITLLGAKLEDRFYNNHSFKNPNVNTNNDEQQTAAVVIQSEYRRFAAKKEVDSIKEDEAATVIQASFRGHMERDTIKTQRSEDVIVEENTMNQSNLAENVQEADLEERENSYQRQLETSQEDRYEEHTPDKEESSLVELQKTREIEEEVIDIDLEDPDVEKAALKIQSVFKGFKGRKLNKAIVDKEPEQPTIQDEVQVEEEIEIQDNKVEKDSEELIENEKQYIKLEEEIDVDLKDPEIAKAAIKIQLVFRCFKIRKKEAAGNIAETVELQDDLAADNEERSASKLFDEDKSVNDEINTDQDDKENIDVVEEDKDNVVEEDKENEADIENEQIGEEEEEKLLEDGGFIASVEYDEVEQFDDKEQTDVYSLKNDDIEEGETIHLSLDQEKVEEIVTEENEVTEDTNQIIADPVIEEESIDHHLEESINKEIFANVEENDEVESDRNEDLANEVTIEQEPGDEKVEDCLDLNENLENAVLIEEEPDNTVNLSVEKEDVEVTEVDPSYIMKDVGNEDDTARDVDDVENDNNARLDEDVESTVADIALEDTDIAETGRSIEVEHEENNESEQQIPKSNLEDTEENGDTEAQHADTSRSEDAGEA